MISALGEDPTREGLVDTPLRAAKAMKFLTRGYTQNLDDILNNAIFESNNDGIVILKNIEFYSLCEHHLLPFFGTAHIGYLPKGKVIGISKLARIVDFFSHRMQIQENLTKQIADCINEVIEPKGVGVIIEAKHMCMMMRGVQKQSSVMSTSEMLGMLRTNSKTRNEFLMLMKA